MCCLADRFSELDMVLKYRQPAVKIHLIYLLEGFYILVSSE